MDKNNEKGNGKGTYKKETNKVFQAAAEDKELQEVQEGDVIKAVLNIMGEKYTLPSKKKLAESALSQDEQEGLTAEYKKILSKRSGKDITLISHFCNDRRGHKASRDIILCAMLMRKQVPNADDASHTLLSMQRGELYLKTYEGDTNCRNLLLRLCFDYASEGNACPVADWLVFTNSLIFYFNMQLHIRMEPIEVGEPDLTFIEDYLPLLGQWEKQLRAVDFCYLGNYRRELLGAYMQRNELTSEAKAKEMILEAAGYDSSYGKKLFSGNPEPCSRQVLLAVANAMGCNLDETNRLLREAQWPALYPKSTLDDKGDYNIAKKLHSVGLGVIERKVR